MSGGWVFICGPSGAGKDSVTDWARDRLAGDARFVFARRLVTRAAGPAGEHDEISPDALARLQEAGKLAWHWQANGHHYAIAAHYLADIESGRLVVVNGSREHVAGLPAGAGRRVLVTAGADVLAQRLRARGREDAQAVARRLARNAELVPMAFDRVLRNDGALEDAGAELASYLLGLVA
jgi:ribose 1,5-bisphosphokinase